MRIPAQSLLAAGVISVTAASAQPIAYRTIPLPDGLLEFAARPMLDGEGRVTATYRKDFFLDREIWRDGPNGFERYLGAGDVIEGRTVDLVRVPNVAENGTLATFVVFDDGTTGLVVCPYAGECGIEAVVASEVDAAVTGPLFSDLDDLIFQRFITRDYAPRIQAGGSLASWTAIDDRIYISNDRGRWLTDDGDISREDRYLGIGMYTVREGFLGSTGIRLDLRDAVLIPDGSLYFASNVIAESFDPGLIHDGHGTAITVSRDGALEHLATRETTLADGRSFLFFSMPVVNAAGDVVFLGMPEVYPFAESVLRLRDGVLEELAHIPEETVLIPGLSGKFYSTALMGRAVANSNIHMEMIDAQGRAIIGALLGEDRWPSFLLIDEAGVSIGVEPGQDVQVLDENSQIRRDGFGRVRLLSVNRHGEILFESAVGVGDDIYRLMAILTQDEIIRPIALAAVSSASPPYPLLTGNPNETRLVESLQIGSQLSGQLGMARGGNLEDGRPIYFTDDGLVTLNSGRQSDAYVAYVDDGCPNLADVNRDGAVNGIDFGAWLNAYNRGLPLADQDGNLRYEPADFQAWLNNSMLGCRGY